MQYIKLILKSAIMSFGSPTSLFPTEHGTETKPTKSTIVGMIAGSYGYDKRDKRIQELYDLIDMKVVVHEGHSHILRDYQIAAPMDFYQKNHSFHNKILKSKVEYDDNFKQTLPFTKYYLSNTGFDVYIGVKDDEKLKEIYDNLSAPIYGIYIGRKNCTPACKVIEDEFKTYTLDEIKNSEVAL